MNKTYSAKSSAIRAASKALNVPRNLKAVTEVADILQVDGGWTWAEKISPPVEPIPAPEPAPEEKPTPEVTVKPEKAPKARKAHCRYKRPREGTKGARIWELADQLQDRKAVLEQAGKEGFNLNMASQAFHHWSNPES